ncbi:hypothetical protein ABZ816_03530 [Actinosynnema sp. NPDC047251]|uniref:Carboxypeptidase regulatory-like domain-containing protein n=1 Tax=Saccharothrix espanaensis (strain ATCC 51144 / DSM 44229 / JCM 9112 / NBRC 15066 / NRRL 15764) TaxID=1179773 RepID=K0K364_SACES|nr:hypothetical protein [Saccharothrix espanaensis]CCH31329.1 hypothetical protein BN6_40430 [Saccharothrix espanaensis DSM 44229]
MTPVDPDSPRGELDELDLGILREVRWLYESLDPVPGDLVDLVRFAVQLEEVDVEVVRIAEHHELAGARGDVRSRLITFTGETLDFLVNVQARGDGTVRIDGWISPPAAHPVEVRTAAGPLRTRSDEEGRFSLDRVPSGLMQFVIRPEGRSGAVSTPTMTL